MEKLNSDDNMNRRSFFCKALAVSTALLSASRGGWASGLGLRESTANLSSRTLLRRLEIACPNRRNDPHFILAATVPAGNIDDCAHDAFGMTQESIRHAGSSELRLAHARRKNDDLAGLRIVELDGFLVSRAEISLRHLHDLISRR
jgi:hypothetical protein